MYVCTAELSRGHDHKKLTSNSRVERFGGDGVIWNVSS